MSRTNAFQLELLGGCRVMVHGHPATRSLMIRQQQVLAYLVLHAGVNATDDPQKKPAKR